MTELTQLVGGFDAGCALVAGALVCIAVRMDGSRERAVRAALKAVASGEQPAADDAAASGERPPADDATASGGRPAADDATVAALTGLIDERRTAPLALAAMAVPFLAATLVTTAFLLAH